VKIVISTDAHTTKGLQAMRYGVQMARRGWIEKKDVINTFGLEKMLGALRSKPSVSILGLEHPGVARVQTSSKQRKRN
jgi:hypothetical protein